MRCDAVGLRAMVQRTGLASGAIRAQFARPRSVAHKIALSIKTLAEHGMRILVIEDEVKTGAYLKKGLEESGYRVDVANTAPLSRTQIASYVWDMNFDSDTNVVEVAIRRLRAKIDDDFPIKLITDTWNER